MSALLLALAFQGADVTSTVRPVDPAIASPYPIGTELVWEVVVDDPERGGAAPFGVDTDGDGAADAHDIAWEVLEPERDEIGGQVDFRRTQRLMPLEGGTLVLPAFGVRFSDGEEVLVEPVAVEVLPELAEGEDAARPAPGFREVTEGGGLGDPRIALFVLAGLIVLPLLALGWFRGRRKKASKGVEAEPTLAERLAGLDPSLEPRRTLAALAPLVRRAAEEAEGMELPAGTDAEWASWWRSLGGSERGPERDPEREDVAQLVEEVGELRYRSDVPTSFAVKDLHGRATALVAGLASTPTGGGKR